MALKQLRVIVATRVRSQGSTRERKGQGMSERDAHGGAAGVERFDVDRVALAVGCPPVVDRFGQCHFPRWTCELSVALAARTAACSVAALTLIHEDTKHPEAVRAANAQLARMAILHLPFDAPAARGESPGN